MSCRTSRPPASVLQLPICICESNRPVDDRHRDGFVGGDLPLGLQRGQCLGEAFEILDAQLRTDVEVLGEMSGAVLQSRPAADDHVVDAVLIERVDRLQRLEQAAGKLTPRASAPRSVRMRACSRSTNARSSAGVAGRFIPTRTVRSSGLRAGAARSTRRRSWAVSGVWLMSLSLLPVSLRSEPLRDLIDASNDHPPLATAATHFRDQEATSNLRFRFVLADSESGSTSTRPAWATKGQCGRHARLPVLRSQAHQ